MMIELAEGSKRKRVYVQGYNRHANYVPGYSRRKALNDSSLFSFRLNDNQDSRELFLVVPDPDGRKAPRAVRVDMFDELPEDEFCGLIDYVRDFNGPEIIDAAIIRYMSLQQLGYDFTSMPTAHEVATSVFTTEPNDTTVTTTSFWDDTTFSLPNKIVYPGGALLLYLILKK